LKRLKEYPAIPSIMAIMKEIMEMLKSILEAGSLITKRMPPKNNTKKLS